MSSTIKTSFVQLDIPLRHSEIEQFRAAVSRGAFQDDRLHNHNEKGDSIHRFPVIQYRAHGGQAAIFGIGEGAALIKKVVFSNASFQIGKRTVDCDISQFKDENQKIGPTETNQVYQINHWLPLGGENYKEWNSSNIHDKLKQLERILKSQIVQIFKELKLEGLSQEIKVEFLDFPKRKNNASVFGNHFSCFDIKFSVNAYIPSLMGLGKATSHGFGWIIPINKSSTPLTLREELEEMVQ